MILMAARLQDLVVGDRRYRPNIRHRSEIAMPIVGNARLALKMGVLGNVLAFYETRCVAIQLDEIEGIPLNPILEFRTLGHGIAARHGNAFCGFANLYVPINSFFTILRLVFRSSTNPSPAIHRLLDPMKLQLCQLGNKLMALVKSDPHVEFMDQFKVIAHRLPRLFQKWQILGACQVVLEVLRKTELEGVKALFLISKGLVDQLLRPLVEIVYCPTTSVVFDTRIGLGVGNH